jgi:hypothetical protein
MNIRILLIVILAVISFISINKLLTQKEKSKDLRSYNEALQNKWSFDVSKKDSTIAIQNQAIVDKDSKLAKQADTIKGLRNQSARVNIITKTLIRRDTFYISELELIEIDTTTYLRLPYSLSKRTKWYGYSITLSNKESVLDSLYFNQEQNIVWGEEDHGFIKNIFKSNLPIVYIQNLNPYTKTAHIENYTFKDYNSTLFLLGTEFNSQAGLGFNALYIKNKFGYEYQYNLNKSHSIGVKIKL